MSYRRPVVVVSTLDALVALGGIVALGFVYQATALPNQQVVPAEPVHMSAEEAWLPELPVRLLIPAIGVDAPVQHVGLADDGAMAVPTNFTDVGWYKEGVRPGMRGSAVITGHLNGKGVPEAVFYKLGSLKVGDEVVVMSEERVEDIFVVVRVETYAYDEPTTEVFVGDDEVARLNLITCGGTWLPDIKLYSERTVVFTVQVTDVE